MSLQRALFNRAEVALSAIAASTVFHALATSPTVWPTAILAALGAVCADALVNYMLVGTGCGLLETNSYSAALPYVREKMLGSAPVEHFVNYLSLAVLGLVFATVYSFFGIWALLASLAPVAAVRQSFLNKKRSMAAEMEATRATELLTATAERMESEKKKDRERIAADLHDEVLPALFKVHLMGEVLKQDVDMGRLLDLDEDLPHLLEATDHAAGRMRALIATLRRSTTQTEGVTPTLGLLVQDIGQNSLAQIRLNAGDVCASPLTQLLIFQIAREALRNAVNHSDARWIDVQLKQDGLHAELTVSDDGKGFSLGDVDTSSHFGLSLMASRARLAGGSLDIRTRLGAGTVVVARVPLDAPVP